MIDSLRGLTWAHTNEGNVKIDLARKARVVRKTTESGDTTEDGVGLQLSIIAGKPSYQLWTIYLCTAISRKCVVPQSLKWAGQWFLVVVMVAVSSYSSGKAKDRG